MTEKIKIYAEQTGQTVKAIFVTVFSVESENATVTQMINDCVLPK